MQRKYNFYPQYAELKAAGGKLCFDDKLAGIRYTATMTQKPIQEYLLLATKLYLVSVVVVYYNTGGVDDYSYQILDKPEIHKPIY